MYSRARKEPKYTIGQRVEGVCVYVCVCVYFWCFLLAYWDDLMCVCVCVCVCVRVCVCV